MEASTENWYDLAVFTGSLISAQGPGAAWRPKWQRSNSSTLDVTQGSWRV